LLVKNPAMTNKSKQQQKMFTMIKNWKESGQTQKAYCEAHSIPYHQFHYWYKRYKLVNTPANDNKPSFVQVQLPATEDKSCAEIIYPNGKKILFHQPVDVSFLKALLG